MKLVLEGSVLAGLTALLPGSGFISFFGQGDDKTSLKAEGKKVDKVPVGRPK